MRSSLCSVTKILFLVSFPSLSAAKHADCLFVAQVGAHVGLPSMVCKLNGNLESDPNLAGKNGIEVCTTGDGATQVARFEWRNGKREGPGWFVDGNDSRIEYVFHNDLGNGPVKVFDTVGQVACTMTLHDNRAEGAVKEFYPNGKLRKAWLFANGERSRKGYLEFSEDGKVQSLTCALQSFTAEDRVPCGFTGAPATTELYTSEGKMRGSETRANGVLKERKTIDRQGRPMTLSYPDPTSEDRYDAKILYPDGKVFQSFSIDKHKFIGRFNEFSKDGKLVRDAQYENDIALTDKLFYLNGNRKALTTKSPDGKQIHEQEFWDNGNMKTDSYYLVRFVRSWDDPSKVPDGVRKEYREDGQLVASENFVAGKREGVQLTVKDDGSRTEENYHNDIRLSLKKINQAGRVELFQEFYEDGSVKR